MEEQAVNTSAAEKVFSFAGAFIVNHKCGGSQPMHRFVSAERKFLFMKGK